jgi:hypothetical protein
MSQESQPFGKDEKSNEKDEEKGRGGEKWRNDALSAIVWAGIFVWAGLVLLADNLGAMKSVMIGDTVLQSWSLIFVGAGILVFLEVAIRLIVPAYRRPVTGTAVFACILLAIGLGGSVGWSVVWPLILILIGVSILVGAMTRR